MQNRPRIYIVGVKKADRQLAFKFPRKFSQVHLNSILDKDSMPAGSLPHQRHATKTVAAARNAAKSAGYNPDKDPIAVDCDSTRGHWMVDKLPCVTAARGGNGGHFLLHRNRKTNMDELLRAQGMNPDIIDKDVISQHRLGEAIGNAMTQTVLEEIFRSLLPAVGFNLPGAP